MISRLNSEGSLESKPTVFIVEDEALIAMELEDRLNRLGYRVVGYAASSEGALEEILGSETEVVLMDVNLPGPYDGIELARRLKEHGDVIVVYLTAYSDAETLNRAVQTEAFGYLIKPFEERELNATIQMALYKHQMERRVEQQNKALARSEQTFRDFFEFMPDGVLVVDESGYITRANQRAVELFGYTLDEFAGMTVEDLMPEERRSNHVRLREGYLEEPVRRPMGMHRRDLWAMRKDRTSFPVDISLNPLATAEGRKVIATVRDISQELMMEHHLNHTQRLEAIGTLASGISHDLNNALAPILMTVDTLKQAYPSEHAGLDLIEESATRAAEMVQQVLEFAKGTEGERAPVHPYQLLAEVERLMRSTFPKNIDISVRAPANLPVVLGDSTQLYQMLLNLCLNARDAMEQGGRLTLEAAETHLDERSAAIVPGAKATRYLVVTVADTGTGISPAILDQIFDPFFTTKPAEHGNGLGLANVMRVARGHGGFVNVSSHPGQGATFSVHIPVVQTHVPSLDKVEHSVGRRGSGERVLFVDDEKLIRDAAHGILTRGGYRPEMAANGREALDRAMQYRSDLAAVVTDLQMPVMDGVAFLKELHKTLANIPVVVATGRLEESTVEELVALSVGMIIRKPFTERIFMGALHSAMSKS